MCPGKEYSEIVRGINWEEVWGGKDSKIEKVTRNSAANQIAVAIARQSVMVIDQQKTSKSQDRT